MPNKQLHFQYKQLRDLFNSGVNNDFQQTQMDQTPGIILDCLYKGRNEDPQPLKTFIICEVSVQGEKCELSYAMALVWNPHAALSTGKSLLLHCDFCSMCPLDISYSARKERSQGQSGCISLNLRVYYKLAG